MLSQYLWLVTFSYSSLLAIYIFRMINICQESLTWIGDKSHCQLLQINHKRSCRLCHNHQFTKYNILVMCYHQNNSYSNANETFMPHQWMDMWILFHFSIGFTGEYFKHICLLNLSGIWIRSWSYTSVWSEKKAILESKDNLVTSIWSHQHHIFESWIWCVLLLEIQLKILMGKWLGIYSPQ